MLSRIQLTGLLLLSVLTSTQGISPLWDSVTTNVHQEYDVHEGNQVYVVRVNMGEYKGTDLVVGEEIRPDSRITLTCTAWYPAEWVYSGDGRPSFTSNTTTENLSSDGEVLPEDVNGAKRYVASITIGELRLRTKDTGRYNCMTSSPETGMKYKTLSAFYHLFVPGEKLFMREKGETINYDLRKSPARIPCGVTNPKTAVSLQKYENGALTFVSPSDIFYHPISGFYPKQEISGDYICTAALDRTFQLMHFKLKPAGTAEKYTKLGKRKPSKVTTRPEDLEWLMYSTSQQNSKVTTKKPKPASSITTTKTKKTTKPYVPYHIRYTSSSTISPYDTFYTSPSTTTRSGSNKPYSIPSKHKPFNPFEYPDIITENITKPSLLSKLQPTFSSGTKTHVSSSSGQVFDFFQPSVKPLKPSSAQYLSSSTNFQQRYTTKPLSPRLTTTPTPVSSRTTPRKYRPTTMRTTERPLIIPEMVICSQYSCGTNAECFVLNVFYGKAKGTKREAGCKCRKGFQGNPYSECYLPTPEMDLDTLYFNSSFRSPLLHPPYLHFQPDVEDSTESTETTADLLFHIVDM